jgi:hypothetical protein
MGSSPISLIGELAKLEGALRVHMNSKESILTFPDLARGSSGVIEVVLDRRLTLGAFATTSLLKVGIPTMVSNAVISPILYILARRSTSRWGIGGD